MHTLSTSRSWHATSHSSSLSLYCLSFISRSLVITSIVAMCSTAKLSMSKVKFHRVVTLRGIMRSVNSRSWRTANHWGRTMVVEFLIANATFRNWQQILENKRLYNLQRYLCQQQSDRLHAGCQLLQILLSHILVFVNPTLLIIISHFVVVVASTHSDLFLKINIPASFKSSLIAASNVGSPSSAPSDVFLDLGKSNCRMMLLTTRFKMCKKHRIWFAGPGKSSSKLASSSIIVSLFEALSQVTERIYTYPVSSLHPLHKINCSPCYQSQNLQGSSQMRLPNWGQNASVQVPQCQEALRQARLCFQNGPWLPYTPCGWGMSMHWLRSSVPLCAPAVVHWRWVHH